MDYEEILRLYRQRLAEGADPNELRAGVWKLTGEAGRPMMPEQLEAYVTGEEPQAGPGSQAKPHGMEPVVAEAKPEMRPFRVSDALRMGVQGLTLGFADEIAGAGAAVVPGGRGYEEARDRSRNRVRRLRYQHPGKSLVAEIIGGFGLPAAGGAKAGAAVLRATGSRVLAGLAGGAAGGAVGGGAAGFGESDGDLLERAAGGVTGAAIGTVAGGTVGGGAALAGRAGGRLLGAMGRETNRARDIAASRLREGLRQAGVLVPADEHGAVAGVGGSLRHHAGNEIGAVGDISRVDGSLAGTRVVDEAGQPRRVFHGTSAAFREFDPAKMDDNALFGPGYYWTEAPNTAGGDGAGALGYADKLSNVGAARRQAERLREQLRDPGLTPAQRTSVEGSLRGVQDLIARADEAAPNVRPARLRIRNPFEADREYSPDEMRPIIRAVLVKAGQSSDDAAVDASLREVLARNTAQKFVERGEASGVAGTSSGENLYRSLAARVAPGQLGVLNAGLREAGFDGITHIGGRNTGSPPHRVWVAFDRQQIRSPWGDPRLAEEYGFAAPAAVGTLARTGVGAAVGAAAGDTPEERATFAAAGALGGAGARRLLRGGRRPSLERFRSLVDSRLSEMGEGSVVADLGENLGRQARAAVNNAPSLAAPGGPVQRIVQRNADTRDRVADELRTASGITRSYDESLDAARAQVEEVRRTHYGPLEEKYPEVTGANVLAALGHEGIAPVAARTIRQRGEGAAAPSFRQIQDVLMNLRDEVSAARAAGRPHRSQQAQAAYDRLLEAVEQDIPEFAPAQAAYREAISAVDAHETGRRIATRPPSDIRRTAADLPQPAREALRVGMLDNYDVRLRDQRGGGGASRFIDAGRSMEERLSILADDPERFNQLMHRLTNRERPWRATAQAVRGNSTTAQQLTDADTFLGDLPTSTSGMVAKLVDFAIGASDADRTAAAEMIGRALLSEGPDAAQLLAQRIRYNPSLAAGAGSASGTAGGLLATRDTTPPEPDAAEPQQGLLPFLSTTPREGGPGGRATGGLMLDWRGRGQSENVEDRRGMDDDDHGILGRLRERLGRGPRGAARVQPSPPGPGVLLPLRGGQPLEPGRSRAERIAAIVQDPTADPLSDTWRRAEDAVRPDALTARNEPEPRARSEADKVRDSPFIQDTLPDLVGGEIRYRDGVHFPGVDVRPGRNFGNRAAGTTHSITRRVGYAPDAEEGTFLHEGGHVFDLRNVSPELEAAVAARHSALGTSDGQAYAMTRPDEHFADAWESGIQFVRHRIGSRPGERMRPEDLREMALAADREMPGTYEVVQHLLRTPTYAPLGYDLAPRVMLPAMRATPPQRREYRPGRVARLLSP